MENKEHQKPITGLIDPELINIHMEAASKDDTRRAITCLFMKHEMGSLHLITTNGQLLLHTSISDVTTELVGCPDFEVMVKVSRKLKKRKGHASVAFTIDGDKVFFRGIDTFDAFEIYTGDAFPKFGHVEKHNEKKVPLTNFKAIKPSYLDTIVTYVGLESYCNPLVLATGGEACYFTRYDGDDDRLAVVMSIRVVS